MKVKFAEKKAQYNNDFSLNSRLEDLKGPPATHDQLMLDDI